MAKQKVKLVIDTNVFIPCGDKSKDKIESIIEFGNKLPELAEKFEIVILLLIEILGEYKSIPARLKRLDCHLRLHRLKKCLLITSNFT